MRFFFAALFFCCLVNVNSDSLQAFTPQQQPTRTAEPEKIQQSLYWIFLTTGKSTEGIDESAIVEMQKAHLENFKRLADQGKLLTAGPLSDPEKRLRGIVVVKAESESQLSDYFQDDPYVKNGYLKIESALMQFDYGVINTKITPQGLEEFRMVILENGEDADELSEQQIKDNRAFIVEMAKDKDLLLTVFLPDNQWMRKAIMVMSKADDDEKITDRVKTIPAVQSGQWRWKIIPLRMGKGTLTAS